MAVSKQSGRRRWAARRELCADLAYVVIAVTLLAVLSAFDSPPPQSRVAAAQVSEAK